MTQKTDLKEQIWPALFMVVPVIILSKLSDDLTDNSLHRILFAGLFGALGGLIGAGILRLVKTKTIVVKIVSLVFLIVLCSTALIVSKKLNNKKLINQQELMDDIENEN